MSTNVFLIAGEASGDVLGASLMRGLKAQGLTNENITGIGGGEMINEGLESLTPMEELCVMGIWEVIWQLPRLIHLVQGVVEEIEKRNPDIVVTIDLPDFNFRVAERLKKRGVYKGKIIHYVAPTVWAWRPGRAKKVAAYLDGMMCLFPFEPPYFEKHGLKAAYVGHPLIEVDKSATQPGPFRQGRDIAEDDLCVGVFFGSREKELNTHSKIILNTLEVLIEQYPEMNLIVPTLPHLEYEILQIVEGFHKHTHIVTDQSKKWDAFASCDLAIAVSGTVGLELAYMNIPHVIGYKTHPVTSLILKSLVKVKNAHLANILLEEEVVPEFLQGKCNVHHLTRGMMRLIRYPEEQEKQLAAFKKLEEMLRLESDQTPSQRAAAFVLGGTPTSVSSSAHTDAA